MLPSCSLVAESLSEGHLLSLASIRGTASLRVYSRYDLRVIEDSPVDTIEASEVRRRTLEASTASLATEHAPNENTQVEFKPRQTSGAAKPQSWRYAAAR